MFDFDGVILTNKYVQQRVTDICVRYISKTTGLSMERSQSINRRFYPLLGHSSKLVNGGSLSNFNSFVYSPEHIEECTRFLHYTDRDRMESVFEVMTDYSERGISPYIFTDAPEQWIRDITYVLGIGVPDSIQIITSGHFVGIPKCDPNSALFMGREFGNDGVILVDDNPIIIKNYHDNTKWDLVYMSNGTDNDTVMRGRLTYMRSDLFQ